MPAKTPAAERTCALHSADTLLHIARPNGLALGMLERYLRAEDSTGLDRSIQNDHEPILQAKKSSNNPFSSASPTITAN